MIYEIIGVLAALFVYIIVIRNMIVEHEAELLNPVTFFLWGWLDLINAIASALKHGVWILPAFYSVASISVPIVILWMTGVICRPTPTSSIPRFVRALRKVIDWGWVEWLTIALVAVCLYLWATQGTNVAILASGMAVVVAGIPQAVHTWTKPEKATPLVYIGFTFANGITIFAGESWTIPARSYATICTILTIIFVLLASRRWWVKPAAMP